jgi:hypothetical protein
LCGENPDNVRCGHRGDEQPVRLNPDMAFVYVSGQGTDSTEQGRAMWARVKGRTENDLFALPARIAKSAPPSPPDPDPDPDPDYHPDDTPDCPNRPGGSGCGLNISSPMTDTTPPSVVAVPRTCARCGLMGSGGWTGSGG